MKDKTQICSTLEEIGILLELKGENPFKIKAYTNAVRTLESSPEGMETLLQDSGRMLTALPGIGKSMADKIKILASGEELAFHKELKAEFPATLFEMFELQGLGPKKIKAVYDKLGIKSISELEMAIAGNKLAELEGFGKKTQENIAKAITHHRLNAGKFRQDAAEKVADEIITRLLLNTKGLKRLERAGSSRRGKETIGDLDFIGVADSEEATKHCIEIFADGPEVENVLAKGKTKASVQLKSGLQCDLRMVSEEEYPFALNYFTGSKEHNIRLRARALKRGWSLNEYRLSVTDPGAEPPPTVKTEFDIYQALGLDYIPPELREDDGEIEAAEAHALPELIEYQDLRGTLHCHTNESDGTATLKEMGLAAAALGLQYLGIADHSKASFQANGLDAMRLTEQVAKIRTLNKIWEDRGENFRLFAGVECDILKDGSLDFPDEVLAQLDYVVASVHSSFTQDVDAQTARIIRAITNPLVTVLGHPTGRLLLERDAYKVNLGAVLDAAATTGTWVELNANPHRLDLDWRWWNIAKAKGVKCIINPDAHSTAGIEDLRYGVKIARKGWLTKKDVMNTLDTQGMEEALKQKSNRTKS